MQNMNIFVSTYYDRTLTVVSNLVIDLFLIVFNTSHIMFFICISLANFHYNSHILSGLIFFFATITGIKTRIIVIDNAY